MNVYVATREDIDEPEAVDAVWRSVEDVVFYYVNIIKDRLQEEFDIPLNSYVISIYGENDRMVVAVQDNGEDIAWYTITPYEVRY